MTRSLKSIILTISFILVCVHFSFGEDQKPKQDTDANHPSLDSLLEHVEKKYANSCFKVTFDQESVLKAMEITDTANGKAIFSHPDKMRWEYEAPQKQTIISNGRSLWIYKPEDNQVIIGKSPEFFGDSKGASFLTDITSIRNKFDISILKFEPDHTARLKLVPNQKELDISYILLSVSTTTYEILQIATYNAYEDENKISFKNLEFIKAPDMGLFRFDIPEGADVLSYEE